MCGVCDNPCADTRPVVLPIRVDDVTNDVAEGRLEKSGLPCRLPMIDREFLSLNYVSVSTRADQASLQIPDECLLSACVRPSLPFLVLTLPSASRARAAVPRCRRPCSLALRFSAGFSPVSMSRRGNLKSEDTALGIPSLRSILRLPHPHAV